MELVNATRKADRQRARCRRPGRARGGRGGRGDAAQLVAPYTAEEMWDTARAPADGARGPGWPTVDPALLVEDSVTAVVQVAGQGARPARCGAGHRRGRACEAGRSGRARASSARAGRAARCARSSCGRRGSSTSCPHERRAGPRWAGSRSAGRPGRGGHRLDVVPAPGSGRGRQHHGGPGAGRHRCDVVRRGRGHLARRGRIGAAVVAGRHDLATLAGAVRRGLRGGRPAGRERHRLGAPVRRHVRDVRRGGARRSQGRAADPGGGQQERRDGARLRGPRRGCRVRRRRRRREGGGRRAGPRRGLLDAVLRRHPRLPAPGRPDRRRAQALFGQALAVKPILAVVDGRVAPLEKVRTTSRALARLAERFAVAKADEHRPTSPCTTSTRRRGRTTSPTSSLPRSPGPTCSSPRSEPSSARTSGRA